MRRCDPDARRSCSAAASARNIGNGLKFHPTVKVAARFTEAYDHDEVPMHRVTEFSPFLTIGGSASRRGQVALAIADAAPTTLDAVLEEWEDVVVYYAAIRSDGSGRVIALPGLRAPLVTYSHDRRRQSRLARGLVHLGEVLLAAGAIGAVPVDHRRHRRPQARATSSPGGTSSPEPARTS